MKFAIITDNWTSLFGFHKWHAPGKYHSASCDDKDVHHLISDTTECCSGWFTVSIERKVDRRW